VKVLVHGEANEMSRLKAALLREFEGEKMEIFNPKNTVPVTLHFRGEKMAKVMGQLAQDTKPGTDKKTLSGILVKRNFNYHILAPNDLQSWFQLNHHDNHALITMTTLKK
jgi:cleavage and polyadenylation specificity factor subunit 3